MSTVVSELVLKFTGDASNALAAIGLLDGKMASAAKNYISNLGAMDSSLSRSSKTQVEAFSQGQLAAAKAAVAQGVAAQAVNDLSKAQTAAGRAVSASADVQALSAAKVEAAQGRLVLAQDAANKATIASGEAAGATGSKFGSMTMALGLVGAGVLVAGGLLAKGAADFQSSTTVLATSGGETANELEAARQGILRLSGSTGTATTELTKGLYMLGSAGFDVAHGGLQALQAAAQGAKAENADLGTVTNALSTVLTDYGIKVTNNAAGQKTANAVMDEMIAITSNGKTTTEALAGSLHSVLPVAAAAGLSFAQVGGAMATLTGEGVSADQASQNLANAIRNLQNPSLVATKEMQAMGLNSNDVASQLGKKGLTGTISDLTTAITAHMGPAGMVLQDTFRSSKIAAQDVDAMIAKMPPNLQALAKEYLNGSVTAKDWRKDLLALDPVSRNLMTQFGLTANKTHQFNDLLAQGSPNAQTYVAALSKMMGGATGLAVALKLSGDHADTFDTNVNKVAEAAKNAGGNVDGWKLIQGNFNQKLSETVDSIKAMAIEIGTAALPMFTALMSVILAVVQPMAEWVGSNQTLTKILVVVVGGIGAFLVVVGLAAAAIATWTFVAGTLTTMMGALSVVVGLLTTEVIVFDAAILPVWAVILIGIGIIAALVAIVILLVKYWNDIIGAFKTVIGWVIKAVDWFTTLSTPLKLLIGTLVMMVAPFMVIIGALILLYQNWDKIWGAMTGVWNSFYSAVIEPIIHAWDAINWGAVWGAIEAATLAVWDSLKSAWNSFYSAIIEPIIHAWDAINWGAVWSGILAVTQAVWSALASGWGSFVNGLSSAWSAVSAPFVAAWNNVWSGMTEAWDAFYAATIGQIIHAWDAINWGAVWGDIESATTAVWGLLKSAWNSFYSAVIEPIVHVWDAINWATVWNDITGSLRTAWSALTSAWSSFVGGLQAVWSAVSTPFVAAWKTVWSDMKKPFADLASSFSSVGSSLTSIWTSGVYPAINTIKQSWNSIWGTLKDAVSGLGKAFSGVGDTITSIWTSGVYPAISSVKKAWDSVWGSLKDSVGSIGKAFSGVGDTITGMWSKSLHPALDSIMKAFSGLGKTASDLWNKDIKPAFDEIGKAIGGLWSSGSPAKKSTDTATSDIHALGTESHSSGITIKTAFDAILDVVKFVLKAIAIEIQIVADVIKVWATVIGWLANEIFAPMFRIIASVVKVAVDAIVIAIDVTTVVIKAIAVVVAWLAQEIFVPMFKLIADAVSVAATLISAAIDVITMVIKGIAVVITWLAQNIVEPMIKIVTDAFQLAATMISGIADAIGATIKAMADVFTVVFNGIQTVITDVWNAVNAVTLSIWNAIVVIVEGIWNTMKNDALTIFTAIQDAIQVVWNTVSTAASTMWNAISTAIQFIWNALKTAAITIFTALQNAIQVVWNTISTAAGVMWNAISNSVIQPVWNALKTAAGAVFTGIQNTIQGVWDNIKTAASTMWNAIVSAVKTAWEAIKAVVRDPINVVIDVVNAFTGGAAKVLDIVGVKILDGAKIPHVGFAGGGQVPGGWGGGDTVPAMLTPGERVLSTHQVKKMGGHGQIDNMLGMAHGGAVPGVQYFADGGVVKSGGMSNGVFHGSWQDNVDHITYQDTNPSGGHFVDAGTLTGYVNGTNSPAKGGSGLGQVAGNLESAAKTVASVPGLVASALVGLGKDFIFGALNAAASLALAPLKAAVGALPDKPLGAAVGKGTANKVLDGIFSLIAHKDQELGHAPVAVGGNGMTGSVSVAQEAAALAYAVAHFMGLPYTWGNNDCSGIVQKSYAAQGVSLPRVSSTQYGASVAVSEATAVPGDLAFYNPGESGAPAGLPGHVGFYAGNGKIFDAYNTSRPIGYDSLSLPGNTFMGIRRPGGVAGAGGPAPAGTGPGVAMTAQQWAVDLLTMLGAPTNPGMINFIWDWEAAEGGVWRNSNSHNPLNIAAFDNNPNNPGSNFATWGAGLQAAARAIGQSNFTGLRAGIMSGNPAAALAALVASPWASSHYNGGSSFPSSPGSYGSTPHLAEGGIVGYSVGGMANGLIRVGENGPETIDLGNRDSYVHRNGSGPGNGIDYNQLAAALQANSGVQIGNINVTQSDATPTEIVDEFNWRMRVARLAVQ